MKKIALALLLLCNLAHSEYLDSDFDGVEDTYDKCPNTPFTELVDINGCSVESLDSRQSVDVIIGVSYSDSDYQTLNKTDTFSMPLQFDYYYENFSLQLSGSYFTTSGNGYEDSGFYDAFVGASYQFNLTETLLAQFGVGLLLPTYQSTLNNNNTDYTASINLSYTFKKMTLFGGYGYTLIGDDDVLVNNNDGTQSDVLYQDTHALSGGVGYYLGESLYASLSYNYSDSIYKNIIPIKTATLYGYYSFDANYFATLSYAYGISDTASKNYLSIRFGYYY